MLLFWGGKLSVLYHSALALYISWSSAFTAVFVKAKCQLDCAKSTVLLASLCIYTVYYTATNN